MTERLAKKPQIILIGGVPFGRDNVGDEAILECIVSIVKTTCPGAEIWVSTDDREATERKLDVKSVPLFGFTPPGFDADEMFRVIDTVDTFIWAGATGLSDYPEIPLLLLQYAADRGKKTAIFCTGMNTELNPFLYKLLPSRRSKVFSLVRALSLGSIDLKKRHEARSRRRVVEMMKKGVESAGLIVLRDAPSSDAMSNLIGGQQNQIIIGADPAIEIPVKPMGSSRFSNEVKLVCEEPGKKIGLCLSAQSPVRQLNELALMFDRLISDADVSVIGIPMNPITDAKLMNDFRNTLEHPEAMCVAMGRFEPDEIAGLASEMDIVISSRLHLLILASISLTPFIGISRGSKVTNFTAQFELPEVGNVDNLDMKKLENEINRLLNESARFGAIAGNVRNQMLKRLEFAKSSLSRYLFSNSAQR